jgi:predicted dehydrogenase
LADAVRWGIAGTGVIAHQFAAGLDQLSDAEVVAVASRTRDGAETFGTLHSIPHRHGSYEALADDPDVDVVYVATPNMRHASDALLFLRADKAVLCEKPFAMSAAEAKLMVRAAAERGLFLMEAMWSRFVPAYVTLRSLLGEGQIGEISLVEADLGFAMPFDPGGRLFSPAMGGGALLDLGVYPVSLCSMVLGPPAQVTAAGLVGSTGVDELVVATLRHAGGGLAVVKAGIRVGLSCAGRIAGSHGAIEIPAFVHCPDHLLLRGKRLDCAFDGEGLRFEAVEVHRCLRAGLTESPVMPLHESVSIMHTLDTIRSEIGVVFPGDS